MSSSSLMQGHRGLILVFILTAIVFLVARSSAQSETTEMDRALEKISRLSLKSQKRGEACSRYFERLRAKVADSEKKEYFVSAGSTQAALLQAPQYPGTPLATGDALDEVLSLMDMPKGAALADLKLSLSRLSDCQSVEFFGVLTRLIDQRTRKFIPADQLPTVRRLILAYVLHEASTGPKFFYQVDKMIDLMAHSIQQRLINATAESRIEVQNLQWRASKIRAEIDPTEIEEYLAQLSHGEELQEDLRRVVEDELENLDSQPGQRLPRQAISSLSRSSG